MVTEIKENQGYVNYTQFVSILDAKLDHDPIHRSFIVAMLKHLYLNGPESCWGFGQNCFKKYNDRVGDNMARRILEGRIDRKNKNSPGLVELGLVSYVKTRHGTINKKLYKLSIFGLLYSIKVCKFTSSELYHVSEKNQFLLPLIFEKIWYLKRNNISLKPLEIIASGKINNLDDAFVSKLPYYEIMNFLIIIYAKHLITQEDFTNFITFWFYTYLIWNLSNPDSSQISNKWQKIMRDNREIRTWFYKTGIIIRHFYKQRFEIVEKNLKETFDGISGPVPKNIKIEDFSSKKHRKF